MKPIGSSKIHLSGSSFTGVPAGICRYSLPRLFPPVILKALRYLCCLLSVTSFAADPWAPWLEPDFPFFSSALDLRQVDPEAKPSNITPRGLVLNLGHDCWACFDTELLRVSAIWSGH